MVSSSSRFISLTRIWLILSSVYAMIGVYFAYLELEKFSAIDRVAYYESNSAPIEIGLYVSMFTIAFFVVLSIVITGVVLYILKRVKKSKESIKKNGSTTNVVEELD